MALRAALVGFLLVALAACGSKPANGGYSAYKIGEWQTYCSSTSETGGDSNAFYDSFVRCIHDKLPKVTHSLALRWAHQLN